MATVDTFFAAIENRISCYSLTNTSPIPDTQIHKIIQDTVKHTPSAFNVQSTRAVVLVHKDHEKLWDIGDTLLKQAMPDAAYQALAPKVQGFKAAYGTVLWFEDQAALDTLKSKNPGIQHVIPDWSLHTSGMHQFIAWTALELEGFGCNLQHYSFMPSFTQAVRETWGLPETWVLHAQLVFGTPVDGLKRSRERTYAPLEERVKFIGA